MAKGDPLLEDVNRATLSNMPDGPSGYVLTAKGAGVDPAWAPAPGVPSGIIAMWHGLLADIPSGWILCDGANGTPNLLARFVEGVASAATNPGATGGAATVTLGITEMPSHGHRYEGFTDNMNSIGAMAGYYALRDGGYYQTSTTLFENTGGGGAHENKPPFYDVAFIMKT